MRLLTREDLPWLQDLCARRYPSRFDSHTTSAWFVNIVLSNPLQFIAIRSDHAFCIAHLEALPWTARELEVAVLFTCAEVGAVWEALSLLRRIKAWAIERGAVRWHLWSETTFELGAMARRLGMDDTTTRYIGHL